MEYSISLWFKAKAHDGKGLFQRGLLVPFVPSVGLMFDCDGDGGEGRLIQEVIWVHRLGQFCCQLADLIDTRLDWQVLRQELMRAGWNPFTVTWRV